MALHPRRVGGLVLRQFYLLRGSPARLLPLFAWVTIDILVWGFITRYLNTFTGPRFNFVPALLGAVLLWDFFVRVMQGITTAFLEDVWSRNFLNIFATPLSVAEYVLALVTSSIGTSSIGLVTMFLLASAVFGLSFLMYGPLLVPFLLVLFAFGISLGILATSVVLRLGPAAEWFVWPVPALVSPFAGVFYPISTLPRWMQFISHLVPPAYVFENLRAMVAGRPVSETDLVIGASLAVLDIAIAGFVFTKVYRHAVKTGLIARYSAESVS